MEDGGVHPKRYDGCCTKQQVKISKATLTSPILEKRSTCEESSYTASLMNDHVRVKVLNGTFKY